MSLPLCQTLPLVDDAQLQRKLLEAWQVGGQGTLTEGWMNSLRACGNHGMLLLIKRLPCSVYIIAVMLNGCRVLVVLVQEEARVELPADLTTLLLDPVQPPALR